MIEPRFLVLLFTIIAVANGAEEKKTLVGLATEDPTVTKTIPKIKLSALQISKNDLDWKQIEAQREANPPSPSLTIGEEFVPEAMGEQTIEDLEESSLLFHQAMQFIERGKGHGREGRLAAFRLFEQAAQLGHTEAKKLTAFAQLFGDYSRWSIEESKKVFKSLEESGSPDAQLALGFMQGTGIGVEKSNQAKAIVYYMFSALGDNPLAQMAMGFRFHTGVGVPQNCESALSYYQKVAKKVAENVRFTTSQAIQRVRLTDETDPTITAPPGSAPMDNNLLEYYRMLADKGDVSAQLGLGQIYVTGGRGIQQNFELAYKYFKAAADTGNANAFAQLGKMYLDGTPFTPADDEKAFDYFLKAADKANPSAQANLGIMFLKGRGVTKNYDKAYKLLTLAADQGHVDGQLYLGEMHLKGVPTSAGVKRDFKQAVKLFQMASQNGHILGYYNLAHMHATGMGVIRSCSHAVELFKSVAERGKWGERLMEAYTAYKDGRVDEAAMKYMFMAELGYEVAQTNLAYILDRAEAGALFTGARENILERAFVNWQRAANQEYPIARVKLGDYYYYGLGTPVDHSLAFTNYKTAVDRHAVAQAMFNIGYMHEVGEGITRDLHLAKRFYDSAVEHSVDAYLPAKMALAKLAIVFFFEEGNKHPLIKYIDETLGTRWDIVAMTVLCSIPLVLLFFRWRRNQDQIFI